MKPFAILVAILFSSLLSLGQVTSFSIDPAKLDKQLADRLDSIYNIDQSTRMAYFNAKQRNESAAVIDSLYRHMHNADKDNLLKVNVIIKQYGWLGPQKVGITGSQGLFLVIQHADLKTQEYYLPMIRAAEKNGEILSSNLAILEDRICMRNGKKQVYGSQGFTDKETGKKYIYPIIDIDNLDERRKAMGMPPMHEYVAGWNAEDYKKDLSKIEGIVKQQKIE
ncbi:DUF6624 domain-containing protein [Pedobacter metabolipauper]|uniref:Uncharacterized protein n=1 Tax=Pedobacter metabolipauper TaxID=425513 RepID=A0A4R6SP28_9SPHI|nr:DUF6624 domain-containing protein [Pedobacter metabolipauper]TDQ06218.1 hypothetical protein ATK78_4599 [Pedobacter metabolipauper]